MSPRLAVLVTALALLTVVLLLSAPRADAACPTEYCTDASGGYTLTVEPLSGPIFGPYADCVWQVHVSFGDGSSADYVFEGEKGLTGSHTFPPSANTKSISRSPTAITRTPPPMKAAPASGKPPT